MKPGIMRARQGKDVTNLAMPDLLYLFIVGLLVFAYFSILTSALGDGDTSWHIAAGKWIFEHRNVPEVDSFS